MPSEPGDACLAWFVQHDWGGRGDAWDADRKAADAVRNDPDLRERREMAERHAKIARALQTKACQRLQMLDASELSVAEVGRWVRLATQSERESKKIIEECRAAEAESPEVLSVMPKVSRNCVSVGCPSGTGPWLTPAPVALENPITGKLILLPSFTPDTPNLGNSN